MKYTTTTTTTTTSRYHRNGSCGCGVGKETVFGRRYCIRGLVSGHNSSTFSSFTFTSQKGPESKSLAPVLAIHGIGGRR